MRRLLLPFLAILLATSCLFAADELPTATDRLGDALPDGALQRLGTLRFRYSSGIGDLCFLTNDTGIIAVSNTLQIWDLAQGGQIATHKPVSGSILSVIPRPDGKIVLIADSSGAVTEYDLEKSEVLHTFPTGQTSLKIAHYSSDFSHVLTTGGTPPTIKEFELATGKELISINGSMHYYLEAVYDADGRTCFVNGANGTDPILQRWDLSTGKLINAWHNDYYAHARSLELSPDGKCIFIGSRTSATEWDVDSYKLTHKYSGHNGAAVTSCTYCLDPNQLLTGSRDGSIRRWDREANKVLLRWFPHDDHVTRMCVSPDGNWVLSYGGRMVACTSMADGSNRVQWDRHNGPVTCVASFPGSERVVSGSSDGTVRIWDAIDGHCTISFEGASNGVTAVAASPCGRRIAVGSRDGVVREFSADGALIRKLTGHFGYIHALRYSPCGTYLFSAADDGTVRRWVDWKNEPASIMRISNSGCLDIDISARAERMLTGSRDGIMRLWDLRTGDLIQEFEGQRGWVDAVAFIPRSGYVISAGRDGRIIKWHVASGRDVAAMTHGGWVRDLACSPDGRTVAACGDDAVITTWNLKTGECIARHAGHTARVTALAVTARTGHLTSASDDTTLLTWDMPTP